MTNYTDKHHADLIRPYMPQRELRVGDRVSVGLDKAPAIIIQVSIDNPECVCYYDDNFESWEHNNKITRLYTFSEI